MWSKYREFPLKAIEDPRAGLTVDYNHTEEWSRPSWADFHNPVACVVPLQRSRLTTEYPGKDTVCTVYAHTAEDGVEYQKYVLHMLEEEENPEHLAGFEERYDIFSATIKYRPIHYYSTHDDPAGEFVDRGH